MQSNQRMLKIVGFEVLNRESSRGIFVTLVDVCPGGFNIRVLNVFFFNCVLLYVFIYKMMNLTIVRWNLNTSLLESLVLLYLKEVLRNDVKNILIFHFRVKIIGIPLVAICFFNVLSVKCFTLFY